MATYFCNCGKNIANFNLCIEHNVAGFPYKGYKTGDLIYLIVSKANKSWILGARGYLLEPTNNKPWKDAEKYRSAFNVNWELIDEVDITEGLRKVYSPFNFGLVLRGKQNLDTVQNKGTEIKNYLNQFFDGKEKGGKKKRNIKEMIDSFKNHLIINNLVYEDRIIKRFICSLAAKPFVILTGNSGTGKTKLALEFARWIGSEQNYRVVPVGADWTDNRSVLGFYNPLIEKYNSTVILDLIIEADENKNQKPFFLILDEMNLSHVERYFADFLSGFESNEKIHLHSNSNETQTTSKKNIPEKIKLPDNLYVIGTVNVDETTYMFSPKVLDRANVIEIKTSKENLQTFNSFDSRKGHLSNGGRDFSEIYLDMSLKARNINTDLPLPPEIGKLQENILNFFELLSEFDYEFGFRTMKESIQYAKVVNAIADYNTEEVSDEQVVQKILPKLNGSKGKLESVLVGLIKLSSGETYNAALKFIKEVESVRGFDREGKEISDPDNLSHAKLLKMLRNLRRDQFVSFI